MRSTLSWLIGICVVGGAALLATWHVCALAADKPVETVASERAEPAEIKSGKPPYSVVNIVLPKPAYLCTPRQLAIGPYVRKPSNRPRAPFQAPVGTTNLALHRPVTSSDAEPIIGSLAQITDGNKAGIEGAWVELGPGLQWVQIDLGQKADIYGICVWHMHAYPRIYASIIVQLSNDPQFKRDVKTVFNNDRLNFSGLGAGTDLQYIESHEGELICVRDVVQARYVRLYSRGSNDDDQSHYTEVEVYGVFR